MLEAKVILFRLASSLRFFGSPEMQTEQPSTKLNYEALYVAFFFLRNAMRNLF